MLTIDFERFDLRDGDKILDLGCGVGRHVITTYTLKNVQAVGVDLSLDDLITANDRFQAEFAEPERTDKSFGLSVADAMSLPFADDSFDKVICSEVLEHIPDYHAALSEIKRVLKPGGSLAASVPRFMPEWVCWRLSREYHNEAGGHVRIFNALKLQKEIEDQGMTFYHRHWAHALHVPYWWLQCLFWKNKDNSKVINTYHRFLVWDLIKKPWITRTLDKLLNPLLGKSIVMYFEKE